MKFNFYSLGVFIFMITFLFSFKVISQKNIKTSISDSLATKSYIELRRLKDQKKIDTLTFQKFNIKLLNKAKREKKVLAIAYGYYNLSIYNDPEIAMKYTDSVIEITKDLNDIKFPAYGYRRKAQLFFKKRNFKEALNNNLLAIKHSKNSKNIVYKNAKFAIGLLKSRIGNYEESLEIYKESFKENKTKKGPNYLATLSELSNSYTHNKILDSASYYNKFGYYEAKKMKNDFYINYFSLLEGINHYHKKNFTATIDSLNKSVKLIKKKNNQPTLAFVYYYLGKSLYQLDKKEKSITYFKKVDTVFQKIDDIHPEVRGAYESLINYYKEKGDSKNQLRYIEKLLKVDSILNSNYKFLAHTISKKYDTVNLIDEKETIINQLDYTKKRFFWGVLSLLVLLALFIILYIYSTNKKKKYALAFDNLMIKLKAQEEEKETKVTVKKLKSKEAFNLPQNITDKITENLILFKKDKKFLDSNITSIEVAKSFNTNVKYLSKVIQHTEQKKFIEYINDLRIDYAIKKLKEDKKFRLYTIKAISYEVGFNNTNSFSRAFLKKTGIKPSIFIKNINN